MNIALVIQHLHPTAANLIDFEVQENGEGQYISLWNINAPQPTQAELEIAWIEVYRKQKLDELKKNIAPSVAHTRANPIHQANAGISGIYTVARETEIRNWIIAVRAAVDAIEQPLLSAQSIAEIDAIAFTYDSLLVRVEAIYATL